MRKVTVIGVTGSFGTGKSTVAKFFKRKGVKVLDADKMAHEVLEERKTSYKKVLKEFGSLVLDNKKRIDRKKLGNLVFSDKRALEKLCGIIHPPVIKKIKDEIRQASRSKERSTIVIDAPLLIEAGLDKISDYVVVVKTSKKIQIKRVMKKTALSFTQASGRIKAEMPMKKKIRMADYIIDNEGSKGITKKKVKKIWEGIKSDRTY